MKRQMLMLLSIAAVIAACATASSRGAAGIGRPLPPYQPSGAL
ncbi:hypothetical protein IP91_00218 [Pseudoduganella lurida]|uniref:Lipoprotein n=1 Tax=Pseudoduganella lurida TaxID=1036180 RepID=A0A562RJ96_9BURK|nr:hypothetical protein [Pseudoduganella lurida]TWI69152.1 hypothetical protein IP91_00218 [Pseudoduganella lurida]